MVPQHGVNKFYALSVLFTGNWLNLKKIIIELRNDGKSKLIKLLIKFN